MVKNNSGAGFHDRNSKNSNGIKPLRIGHSLVRTHPESGRKALYVNPGFTIGIEGLAETEGAALLEELFGHNDDARFQYRHVWRQHDLVFWDNRCVMHQATGYDPSHTRHMLRTTVKGDRPF